MSTTLSAQEFTDLIIDHLEELPVTFSVHRTLRLNTYPRLLDAASEVIHQLAIDLAENLLTEQGTGTYTLDAPVARSHGIEIRIEEGQVIGQLVRITRSKPTGDILHHPEHVRTRQVLSTEPDTISNLENAQLRMTMLLRALVTSF